MQRRCPKKRCNTLCLRVRSERYVNEDYIYWVPRWVEVDRFIERYFFRGEIRGCIEADLIKPLLIMAAETSDWKWVTLGQYIDEKKRDEAFRQKQIANGPRQLEFSEIRFDVSVDRMCSAIESFQ